jgi:hypothetical protein
MEHTYIISYKNGAGELAAVARVAAGVRSILGRFIGDSILGFTVSTYNHQASENALLEVDELSSTTTRERLVHKMNHVMWIAVKAKR